MYLCGIITEDGVIDGSKASISPRIEEDGRTFRYRLSDNVVVTQNDVRAIQLAKAALYAGFRLLMDKLEIDHVDQVVLAGAFGTYIEPKYAMVLGDDSRLRPRPSALGGEFRRGRGADLPIESGAEAGGGKYRPQIEKIETAVEPAFQDHFVKAMAIPHKTDPYAKLAAAVKLPPRGQGGQGGQGGDATANTGRRTSRRRR